MQHPLNPYPMIKKLPIKIISFLDLIFDLQIESLKDLISFHYSYFLRTKKHQIIPFC